ncbi:TPA: exoribonuclease II [Salmonella enterica subsp. enterica serovar Gallinarum]|uniref:exoribonuclease II n=1 Tax=Salmonella enterica TaxID=28901 RepID=UPI0009AA4F1F|nr:exoribonuclease II [Salmonella enterica]QUZ39814.1 exoribonuclease II [Salmonella enterica subsp. enterica serovar Pullorum str. CFSAN000606]HBZ5830569.1 exoribonuclease II [Salmonella enterica subsp. enterica serovar Gallinarum]HBZ5847885.1 exoribonuclease II [Salmonella enterica subsp. enterica serovar Gallinarum]HBZ5856914.1 exoribonuclease II [Salmonella enterica subsp. enterica serovar Gallinarum]HBZ5931295.1 exoribonuclease II [Salmonella enterica subsp. enterica serovar Gallinarum]
MFQDNPLLAQLKQQLHSQTPRAEGVVKATEKGFGFLEVDAQKSYFIPPPQMKKVMHGDRIVAVIHTEKERESAEPEELIEPFLTRFVGKVQGKNDRLSIVPDHPLLKDAIPCRAARGVQHEFKEGDWAVAEMRRHPLKGDRSFYADLTQYITFADDHFVPWWVTLARHNLEKEAPNGVATEMLDEGLERQDLTALNFVTIDSASTEDMDDALYAEELADGRLQLTVAIADPTAWIAEGSKLDNAAKIRAFTNYLPGFNIPMLPRELSDDLCSLRANEVRPALACRMIISADGTIDDDIAFFAATIESKAKLAYDNVSDWLENNGTWQPDNEGIAQQIRLLHRICLSRSEWRHHHALVFKDRPDYRFVLGEKGEVLDIVAEPRRIANRIVEESMIAANLCAARVLRDKLGFGIYNVHTGFDPANADALAALLKTHGLHVDAEEVLTLEGFCKLRRELDAQPSGFLDSRIRRFQSFAEISTEPGPHFGLGLEAYATWTSPIRKYGDMINHRLLKAVIKGEAIARPQEDITQQMAERRRLNRMAERDVGDWLYARFLNDKAGTNTRFAAEIIDVSRGGMRVRLVDNGAIAFIPAPLLHAVHDELVCSQENGTVQIKGETVYKVTDVIDVTIAEVRMETRSIIARPAA